MKLKQLWTFLIDFYAFLALFCFLWIFRYFFWKVYAYLYCRFHKICWIFNYLVIKLGSWEVQRYFKLLVSIFGLQSRLWHRTLELPLIIFGLYVDHFREVLRIFASSSQLRDYQIIHVFFRWIAVFLAEAIYSTSLFFFGPIEEQEVIRLFITIVQIIIDVVWTWPIVVLWWIFDKKLVVSFFFLFNDPSMFDLQRLEFVQKKFDGISENLNYILFFLSDLVSLHLVEFDLI